MFICSLSRRDSNIHYNPSKLSGLDQNRWTTISPHMGFSVLQYCLSINSCCVAIKTSRIVGVKGNARYKLSI